MQLSQTQFIEWLSNFIEVSTEYKDHLSASEVQVIWDHLMNITNDVDDLNKIAEEAAREAIEEMCEDDMDDPFLREFLEELNRQAKDAAARERKPFDPTVDGDRTPPYRADDFNPWVTDIKPEVFLSQMNKIFGSRV